MSMALYAIELAILAAAIIAAVWLRREGDRLWSERRARQVRIRMVLDTSRFTAAMAGLAPALTRMGKEAAEMERAMQGLRDVLATPPAPMTTTHPRGCGDGEVSDG